MGNGIASSVFAGVALAIAIATAAWAVVQGNDVRDLAAQLETARAEVATLQTRLDIANRDADELRAKLSTQTNQLAATNTELRSTASQLANSSAKAKAAQSQARVLEAQARVAETQAQEAQSKAQAAEERAKATAAALAQVRPELPVRLVFRRGVLGGYVAMLENTSASRLEVSINVENSRANVLYTHSLFLDPDHSQQFGKRQGWEFEPGQIVSLNNPQFKTLRRTVAVPQAQLTQN